MIFILKAATHAEQHYAARECTVLIKVDCHCVFNQKILTECYSDKEEISDPIKLLHTPAQKLPSCMPGTWYWKIAEFRV